MRKPILTGISALEVLDSRGNPTVEATVQLENGICASAAVPSGASTGIYEALELRDGDAGRYGGKGVTRAVTHVQQQIADALRGCVCEPKEIDSRLLRLDGTEDKSALGANAILAVSLASAKAAAAFCGLPLYRYLGGTEARRLPIPMMNILNGGAHAGNSLDIQEFMIVPVGFSCFREALRAGVEIYHALGKLLKSRGLSVGVGDEGGFAPDFDSAEEALDAICQAIDSAGYDTQSVRIALDVAASEWAEGGAYHLPKAERRLSREDLAAYLTSLCGRYPILSVEDGMGEEDEAGWKLLTGQLGSRVMLVGDDLFVTNEKRFRHGIEAQLGNAILIKPNQIGTLSETLAVTRLAARSGCRAVLSHRSGETEDTTIADLAVGCGCGLIKTGAPCRGERTAKYNRLLRIEAELGSAALFDFS